TPLCPAGHLPRKGGDRPSLHVFANLQRCKMSAGRKLPISPLAGEMSGRTEGGAVPPASIG
ncbi:MAG: endonuclease domain-containing protein, partial [Mesorhizobium sp.]